MSVFVPADHHATFAGWESNIIDKKPASRGWSRRRQVGFILISALASWILILSPFVLSD